MPLIRNQQRRRWTPSADSTTTNKNNTATTKVLENYLNILVGNKKDEDNKASNAEAEDEGDFFVEALFKIEELIESSEGIAATCLICLEDIATTDATFSCCDHTTNEGCFSLFHLSCIQAWARNTITNTKNNAWGCPKCRREYPSIPTEYLCFCGASVDPAFNPWEAPHSCGEECRVPSPLCGHPCMLLCHPGPHPPCPRIVTAHCFCGKKEEGRRCGLQDFSCRGLCAQPHGDCGHPCPAICHPGTCPPCVRIVTASCRCGGSEKKEIKCSEAAARRCHRQCHRLLGCGIHTCSEVCCDHDTANPDNTCPLSSTAKTCPCGKTVQSNIECGVSVPCCGNTCDKILACGVHRCQERCHTGPCSITCRTPVEKRCRCGYTSRTVQCTEEFKCDRRCTQLRACGRHQCKRRCCDGTTCPPCPDFCGRRLLCRNHKCVAPCHPGPCLPCPLTSRISCACGQTSYRVPCGREGGAGAHAQAQPPVCHLPCLVSSTWKCRHITDSILEHHTCHYGPCPPCGQGCNTPRTHQQRPCSHPCPLPCHDPPPPPIPASTPPPPPISPGEEGVSRKRVEALQAKPAAVTLVEGLETTPPTPTVPPCPPCQVMVPVTCLGGHKTIQKPCCESTQQPFSCGVPCGRPLACSWHTCQLACHKIRSSSSSGSSSGDGDGCEECTRRCQQPRACPHPCVTVVAGGDNNTNKGRCHPGPCSPCTVPVGIACYCKKTTLYYPCHQLAALPMAGKAPSSITTATTTTAVSLCCDKVCGKPLLACPHLCTKLCHMGPCDDVCVVEVTVRCGCKKIKKKVPCNEVRQLLRTQGCSSGSSGGDGTAVVEQQQQGWYDETTSLRLLPCDDDCRRAAVEMNSSKSSTRGKEWEGGERTTVGSGEEKNVRQRKKELMQKERAAEAGRREEERKRMQEAMTRQKRVQMVVRIVLLLVLIGVVVGGGLVVRHLVAGVDRVALEAWGDKEH